MPYYHSVHTFTLSMHPLAARSVTGLRTVVRVLVAMKLKRINEKSTESTVHTHMYTYMYMYMYMYLQEVQALAESFDWLLHHGSAHKMQAHAIIKNIMIRHTLYMYTTNVYVHTYIVCTGTTIRYDII